MQAVPCSHSNPTPTHPQPASRIRRLAVRMQVLYVFQRGVNKKHLAFPYCYTVYSADEEARRGEQESAAVVGGDGAAEAEVREGAAAGRRIKSSKDGAGHGSRKDGLKQRKVRADKGGGGEEAAAASSARER